MGGRAKLKLAVAGWLAYCILKEAVSPSPWNTHDPGWQYPQIYTGEVPAELYEIRARVAPGPPAGYYEQQPTAAETGR